MVNRLGAQQNRRDVRPQEPLLCRTEERVTQHGKGGKIGEAVAALDVVLSLVFVGYEIRPAS